MAKVEWMTGADWSSFDVEQFRAATHLNSDHRDSLKRIFGHPASGNIEWRQVRSLLEALGAATEERNGRLKVTLGGETEVFRQPHGKEIDRQMIVDLRRMLTAAEHATAGLPPTDPGGDG